MLFLGGSQPSTVPWAVQTSTSPFGTMLIEFSFGVRFKGTYLIPNCFDAHLASFTGQWLAVGMGGIALTSGRGSGKLRLASGRQEVF